jgi:hypothetical protein
VFGRPSETCRKGSSLETFRSEVGMDVNGATQAGCVLTRTSIQSLTKGTQDLVYAEISRNPIWSSGGMMPSVLVINLEYYRICLVLLTLKPINFDL